MNGLIKAGSMRDTSTTSSKDVVKRRQSNNKPMYFTNVDSNWLIRNILSNEQLVQIIKDALTNDQTFITEISNQIDVPPQNTQQIINQLIANDAFVTQVAESIPPPMSQGYVQGIFPVVSGVRNNVQTSENWDCDLLVQRRGNLLQIVVLRNPVNVILTYESSNQAFLRQFVMEIQAPSPFIVTSASGTLIGTATGISARQLFDRLDIPDGPDADFIYENLNNLVGAKLSTVPAIGQLPTTRLAIGRYDPNNASRVLEYGIAANNNFDGGRWYTNVAVVQGSTFTFVDLNPPDLSALADY